MINVVEYGRLPVAETPHGVDVRKVFETEHVQVMEITLKPGEALKKHVTPVDVFFYVLEGAGVVEIGDELVSVRKDQLVESPKGVPHLLSNDADAPFRFLVVKTPRPESRSRLL